MSERETATTPQGLILTQPASASDWEEYYDLRWRILRKPWNQTRGSERDERDTEGFHAMVREPAGSVLAIGRLHLNTPGEAQIRYMAVDEQWRNRGLGTRILDALETQARNQSVERIVLNSREDAVKFYVKHGYQVERQARTLFGDIRHIRMRKDLKTPKSAENPG
jgi:ribosomal protein S18 acetylase RimI-like enzyme